MDVDRERSRVQRVAGERRDAAEIEGEVLDLSGPIAAEMNLGAAADCEACLRRGAGEAAAHRARAGGDGGGLDRNLDPNGQRVASPIDAPDGGVEEPIREARARRETSTSAGHHTP